VQPEKLQQAITCTLERKLTDTHKAGLSRFQQTVLTALAAHDQAGCAASAWLTVLPTDPAYRMRGANFRTALRHRLGMLPADSLRNRSCTHCKRLPPFTADPDHFHSCPLLKRTACTQRHNDLMDVVMALARSVGYTAIREPTHHLRPETLQRGALDYNAHGDILLLKHDERLYLDVSVTRPTNATNLARATITTAPLIAAKRREREKHAMYDELCELNGYTMTPFVLETYGGLGSEAYALLEKLARHAEDGPHFLRHALNRLSIVLQSGNAAVAHTGLTMLNVSRHHARTLTTGARLLPPLHTAGGDLAESVLFHRHTASASSHLHSRSPISAA